MFLLFKKLNSYLLTFFRYILNFTDPTTLNLFMLKKFIKWGKTLSHENFDTQCLWIRDVYLRKFNPLPSYIWQLNNSSQLCFYFTWGSKYFNWRTRIRHWLTCTEDSPDVHTNHMSININRTCDFVGHTVLILQYNMCPCDLVLTPFFPFRFLFSFTINKYLVVFTPLQNKCSLRFWQFIVKSLNIINYKDYLTKLSLFNLVNVNKEDFRFSSIVWEVIFKVKNSQKRISLYTYIRQLICCSKLVLSKFFNFYST